MIQSSTALHLPTNSPTRSRVRIAVRTWLRTFDEWADFFAFWQLDMYRAAATYVWRHTPKFVKRWLARHVEVIEVGTRFCRRCITVHSGFHRCPNRLWAWCDDCGHKRLLDERGQFCPSGHLPAGRRHLRRGGDRQR